MNYNEFVSKNEEEKKSIWSGLNNINKNNLLEEIKNNNDRESLKIVWDNTDDTSRRNLLNAVTNDSLSELYSMLHSNNSNETDRQRELLKVISFDKVKDLYNLVNSNNEDNGKNFLNKLGPEKLESFYDSFNDREKKDFFNKLIVEKKADLLFGVFNRLNDDVEDNEKVEAQKKQVKIFREYFKNYKNDLKEVMHYVDENDKLDFVFLLDQNEMKFVYTNLADECYENLSEDGKNDFLEKWNEKISELSAKSKRGRSGKKQKELKSKVKWLNKIKNKCLGLGIFSRITDRISNNEVDSNNIIDENENDNDMEIEVTYYTTYPMRAMMKISALEREISRVGAKYYHNGKLVTNNLLEELKDGHSQNQSNENENSQAPEVSNAATPENAQVLASNGNNAETPGNAQTQTSNENNAATPENVQAQGLNMAKLINVSNKISNVVESLGELGITVTLGEVINQDVFYKIGESIQINSLTDDQLKSFKVIMNCVIDSVKNNNSNNRSR